jgi:hypothetical protein
MTCLESQQLASVAALTNLFNVDMEEMSMYSTGTPTSLEAPPKGYHWGWSDEAKEEARKLGWEKQTQADAARRRIERSEAPWAKPFRTPQDNTAEGMVIMIETLIDLGVGYGAAQKAGDDPSSVGVPPDRLIPNTASSEKPPDEKPPTEKPPTEKPPAEEEQPPPEKPPQPPSHHESEAPDLVAINHESIFRGDIKDVDLTDDIIATPVMQDETTRTAMQRCHESVEAELWEEIGSTTTALDTETPEEAEAKAEHLKSLGICDNNYYGHKACTEWKRRQGEVPLAPEDQAAMNLLKQHSVCPANMVSRADCNKAKQQMFMRFAIPDIMAEPIKNTFRTGKAIPWMPRLDLDLGTGVDGSLRPAVVPIFKTKEEVPDLFSLDGNLKLLKSPKRNPSFVSGFRVFPGHQRPGHNPIRVPSGKSDDPLEIPIVVGPNVVKPFHVGGQPRKLFPVVRRDEL